MNDPIYKQMTSFLLDLGIEDMAHTGKTYMSHLLALYRMMQEAGCDRELCRAGLFHSIYGTEEFQRFQLPLERRTELQALIGVRAERLAYLNCAMDRASFDASLLGNAVPFTMRDRLTGEALTLSDDDVADLCKVHLYDWLEQVPRSRRGYSYRRAAYRAMAERLGGEALAVSDRTFAIEPQPV